MPSVLAYYRPTSLDEANDLLNASQRWALAGGTIVVPEARKNRAEGVEVVDLQDLGLDTIELEGEKLRIGAMVRLSELLSDDRMPNLLKEAAQRELPSALRNQATVGGSVAQAESESLLVAGLLAQQTIVEFHGQPSQSLGDFLQGDRQGLITGVLVEAGGTGFIASTGRTPADTPIVAAVASVSGGETRLALTGVAATPVEVDPASPDADLDPPGDFRGTSSYRIHLANVLSERAIQAVLPGKSN